MLMYYYWVLLNIKFNSNNPIYGILKFVACVHLEASRVRPILPRAGSAPTTADRNHIKSWTEMAAEILTFLNFSPWQRWEMSKPTD